MAATDIPNTDALNGTEATQEQQVIVASHSVPSQLVVAGHGTELYNLYTGRQINFFSVFDSASQQWLTYRLPMLNGGEEGSEYLAPHELRESCPVVCQPTVHSDGTIYIGAAGGVLNRLTPNGEGSYDHSYILLGQEQSAGRNFVFAKNLAKVKLIAEGDTPVKSVAIARTVNKKTVFESLFRDYQTPSDDFNMLTRQGLIDTEAKDKIWAKQKREVSGVITSIDEGVAHLKTLDQSSEEGLVYLAQMARKDGPMRGETTKIWERNSDTFGKDNSKEVLEAAENLMPGLGKEWKDHLYNEKGKWKIYDERLPVYRVAIGDIPGTTEEMVVTVLGSLYRMKHTSGELVYIGTAPQEADRAVDTRAVIALDENTFVMGDMGTGDDSYTGKTLRIIVDKQDGSVAYDEALTSPLLEKLYTHWTPGARVKSIAASRECETTGTALCTTLFFRTKHAGKDLVEIEVHLDNGVLTTSNDYELSLTDTYNNEYMAVVGNTLMTSMETEDYARTFHLFLHGQASAYEHAYINSYITGEKGSEQDAQKPEFTLPALPKWLPYTGWGLDGISAR